MKRSAATERAVIENARHITSSGPTRVAVRSGGAVEGRRPEQARTDRIVVVYIRDDGWSLGASAELRDEAERLWSEQWIGRMEVRDDRTCEIVVKDDHGFEYTAGFMDAGGVMRSETGEVADGDEEDDEADVFGGEEKKPVTDVRPEGRSLEEVKKWIQGGEPSEKAKAWKATREAIAQGRVKIPKDSVTRHNAYNETIEVFGPDSFPGEDTPHAPAVKKMKSVALPHWFAGITKERGR